MGHARGGLRSRLWCSQLLRQITEETANPDVSHGLTQGRIAAAGTRAFEGQFKRLAEITRIGAVHALHTLREILRLEVCGETLPRLAPLEIGIVSAIIRFEDPAWPRNLHHPRSSLLCQADLALLREHVIDRSGFADLRQAGR